MKVYLVMILNDEWTNEDKIFLNKKDAQEYANKFENAGMEEHEVIE